MQKTSGELWNTTRHIAQKMQIRYVNTKGNIIEN